MEAPCVSPALFLLALQTGEISVVLSHISNRKNFLATIHLMDSKRFILNLLVAPGGVLRSRSRQRRRWPLRRSASGSQ
jgi:hypothetical protein